MRPATALWLLLAASTGAPSRAPRPPPPVTHHWATPIWEDELAAGIRRELEPRLTALARELEGSVPSARKSNVGGWQSPPLSRRDHPALATLAEHILTAATLFVSEGLGADMRRQRALLDGEYRLEMVSVWLNANRRHDYNVPHTHTDSFLSGVYFVSISEGTESSELVLSDPRVQLQQFEYHDWFGMGLQRRIVPTPGKLVLWPSWLSHRVEPVADDAALESEQSERISVSFNLAFGPAEPRPNG